MKDFDGKIAVVTGGASGIGLGLAEQALKLGMKVVIADVEQGALDAAVESLGVEPDQLLAVRTDVSVSGEVQALARRTLDAFGAVHLLFNNAGVGATRPLWETSEEDWHWLMGVNLHGVFHGVRAFTPIMIEQGEGYIVNTASIAGMVSARGTGAYTVSKQAVVSMTELLYGDLKQAGANVGASVLCPSFVKTQIYASTRNRSEAHTALKSDAELTEEQVMEELSAEVFAGAMTPQRVAEQVFDAISRNQFYIFTHPKGSRDLVEQRARAILDGQSAPDIGPEHYPADP